MAATKAVKKAAKKAVKKVAATRATKAGRKMVNAADPFYVVLERGFLTSKVVGLYTTREDASNKATAMDAGSNALVNRYTVQRVDLVS